MAPSDSNATISLPLRTDDRLHDGLIYDFAEFPPNRQNRGLYYLNCAGVSRLKQSIYSHQQGGSGLQRKQKVSSRSTVRSCDRPPFRFRGDTLGILGEMAAFTITPFSIIVNPTSGAQPGSTTLQGNVVSSVVPEPMTLGLVGGGLIGLGLLRRRKAAVRT